MTELRSTILYHGQAYHLRSHSQRLQQQAQNFPGLLDFLEQVHSNCPTEPFQRGPRSSGIHAGPQPVYQTFTSHTRIQQTADALLVNSRRFHERHEQVQMFMMENCPDTVAMEVPVWVTRDESGPFAAIIQQDEWLSGHIDVLSIEDNCLWIWDYKPKAHSERWVHVQLLAYAKMLSERTSIPLPRIRCGYFDQYLCCTFSPSENLLNLLDFYSYVPSGQTRQRLLQPKPSRQHMPTVRIEADTCQFVPAARPPAPPRHTATAAVPEDRKMTSGEPFRAVKNGPLTSFRTMRIDVPVTDLYASALYSWHLFVVQQQDPDSIARLRGMTAATIGEHLLQSAAAGLLDYRSLVDPDVVSRICDCVNTLDENAGGLRVIYETLQADCSYLQIKAALHLGRTLGTIAHPAYVAD